MAAGCYVVGYTGDGGREFMNPSWCSPIGDEDIVSFAEEAAAWSRDVWDDDARGGARRRAIWVATSSPDTYTP